MEKIPTIQAPLKGKVGNPLELPVSHGVSLPMAGQCLGKAETATPLARAKEQITIPELAARLFPGWRAGPSSRSPFRKDSHPSFSVYAEGKKWKDHATGEHGGAVDFLAKARGIDKSAAARELIALANTGTFAAPTVLRIAAKQTPTDPIRPMPANVAAIWAEGVQYLVANPRLQQGIDQWRKWPAGTARKLAEDGLMGCPIVNGRRGIAFSVQAPYRDAAGGVSTVDSGIHFRPKPIGDQLRVIWIYRPNPKADGVSCRALPFVIGGGFVPYANTVVVTEGQWDAITLAVAAGWLGSDAAWPEHIAVFATRGAGAWQPLIDVWGSYWPRDAEFVLFADGDEAGATWKAPGGFKDTLCKLGHNVRVIRPQPGGPKDLNDIHRANPISPETVEQWISMERCPK